MADLKLRQKHMISMKDDSDWYLENVRRKTLARINIAKEVGKHNLNAEKFQDSQPTKKQIHQRFKMARDLSKPSFGMTMLGLMLTLFSVVVVSTAFITTVDSYDLAVQDTNQMGVQDNSSGGVLNPYPNLRGPLVRFAHHGRFRRGIA